MFGDRINNWKRIVAGFSAFGFILSIITGIIGTALPGAVFMRAVIFAVLFGVLGFIILFITDRFVPEFFVAGSEDEMDYDSALDPADETLNQSEAAERGTKLDITVEDEEFGELENADESGSADEGFVSGPESEGGESGEVAEAAENGETEEAEELEEVSDAGESEGGEQEANTAEEEGKDRKSELPDIGGFSNSFENTENVSGNSDGLSSIDGGTGGAEIMGGMHETQEIVRAVQTVLKKDQEG